MLIEQAPFHQVLGIALANTHIPDSGKKELKMLIAGCGTGRHVAQSATAFKDVHITAVDLSKTSLSYAKRKIQEYGFDKTDVFTKRIYLP